MKNFLTSMFYGPINHTEFMDGLELAGNQVKSGGVFRADNLFTLGKSLGFLEDEAFMAAFQENSKHSDPRQQEMNQSIIWRTHVLSWAAAGGLNLEGDFVECACYKGTSAKILCEYLDFNKTGKHYYLYDLFQHEQGMDHHAMPDHGSSLYDYVRQRFVEYPNVHVIKGAVPDILQTVAPEKIAFMHLDINSAAAEIGALEMLFDRIVPGGILILDDYGWIGYKEQKEAEDPFFAERGYHVLELPTGQGMVIK